MRDPLNNTERSVLMAKVKSRGNKSTEMVIRTALRKHHISGWRTHPKNVLGRPDFYFALQKLAIFVDGCFWHACPKCGRIPKSRVRFWTKKITSNRRRDARTRRKLRRDGYRVVRIWEHGVRSDSWVRRLQRMLGTDAQKGVPC